jgi:type II secretory pathway component PulM
MAEVFSSAISQMAEERGATVRAAWGAGIYRYLAQLSPRQQTALLAGLTLFFAVLLAELAVQFAENRRLQRELASTHAALQSISGSSPGKAGQDSPDAKPATTASPGNEPSPSSSPQRPAHVETADALRGLLQPQINTSIFALNAVRGADPNLPGAGNEIEVTSSPQWLIFSVELDDKPKYQTYRATIFTAEGRQLWSASGLQPNRYDAFVISFPSTFFQPQNYSLVLEGKTPNGEFAVAANYSFRIARKNR